MKLFSYGKDGGPESTVWGYWLIEVKSLFSIALLCFEDGSRDAYHSHAFHSLSWLLKGWLVEHRIYEPNTTTYRPSLWPIWTSKSNMHKVRSMGRSWVLTFRGPWASTWQERGPDRKLTTLAHGRKVV